MTGISRIDLNADLAEGVTDDDGLLAVVTSANVACGFHAGDAAVMRRVCDLAAERGVVVGAQVSYLDRAGFGRRSMDVEQPLLTSWVAEQVGLLTEIAVRAGVAVDYVKPHGALYNRVVFDDEQAAAVLAGSGDLPVLGLPGSVILATAAELGRRVVPEGFPDRGYDADGRLLPRTDPGALLHDPGLVAAHALDLVGEQAPERAVQTLCLHGDSPDAVQVAHRVRSALVEAGWELRGWDQ